MLSENKFKYITYQNMFWLFISSSVIGVFLEGLWSLYKPGHWETHVVSIWGPFCIIYGIGSVVFYIGTAYLKNKNIVIKFIIFALIANIIEYTCGWLLEHGLHMKAWDYSRHFLNLNGYISLEMTLLWGFLGVWFAYFLVPFLNRVFKKMYSNIWKVSCVILTAFMIVNFIVTSMCIIRWKDRHDGKLPVNYIERVIDERYDDNKMQKRFVEWSFIDK